MLTSSFFDDDPQIIAKKLLGTIIKHKVDGLWLKALIIETECYYKREKASHASLGWTHKRRALFMPPGTIYMYYARGGDSFNISCRGEGNAVLLKSGLAWPDPPYKDQKLALMQKLNPKGKQKKIRPTHQLAAGQTLLCKTMGLKVRQWDAQQFKKGVLELEANGVGPKKIIQTTRLGIPQGRDEHLPYRFIHFDFARYCTQNVLTRQNARFKLLSATAR